MVSGLFPTQATSLNWYKTVTEFSSMNWDAKYTRKEIRWTHYHSHQKQTKITASLT